MYDYELMNNAREHYELRVKAVERARRLSQLNQDEPGLARHLLGKLGHLLVRTGERLQWEYAPETGRP